MHNATVKLGGLATVILIEAIETQCQVYRELLDEVQDDDLRAIIGRWYRSARRTRKALRKASLITA